MAHSHTELNERLLPGRHLVILRTTAEHIIRRSRWDNIPKSRTLRLRVVRRKHTLSAQ